MNFNYKSVNVLIRAIIICFAVVLNLTAVAQGVTKVSGNVIDKYTKEPIPFVNIYFENTNVGTTTDLDGYFEIDSRFVTPNLCASFLGYKDQCQRIQVEEKNKDLVFALESESVQIEDVVIVAKKEKYSKKNNPAVELMRKVIDNKGENRLEGQDYYSYDKYERIELDLNNITEEFKDRRIFKKFDLLWDYLDTSSVNGKVYLPIYLREANSTVYYRKDPEAQKEYRHAINLTEFDETVDEQSISDALDFIYQDVNVYDNVIRLLDNNFISPLAPQAINFYRFYILDTTYVNGINSIRLGFIPRNKANFGFTGDLYVSNDSSKHFVVRADFGIIGDINLNFVRDLRVRQDFTPMDDTYVLTRDEIVIDYSVSKNGVGFYGTRTIGYSDFEFERHEDPGVYDHIENVIDEEDIYEKDKDYWKDNRMIELTENQQDLYYMVDTLRTLPAYKRLVTGVRILTSGYIPFKNFDVGPLPTIYSYNDVEGHRVRLGFETNFDFSKQLLIDAYGAYGFGGPAIQEDDQRWKFRLGATYSFNEDWKVNPRHFVRLAYQNEATFPGQALQFLQQDNVLLSLRRGNTDRMILEKELRFEYTRETPGFAFDFYMSDKSTIPYGRFELPFINEQTGENGSLENFETTTLGLGIEIAPNKQFIQGRQYRTPIINQYPIFTMRYEAGVNGLLGGDYGYHKVEMGYFKRFNLATLGHINVAAEGGRIWGDLPYLGLFIPRANQSFAYQRQSFNLMNFMEFVSDQYVHVRLEHFFKGFFFNRVPLLKKLGLREIATFKMVHGSLGDSNNPNVNQNLPQFAQENGVGETVYEGCEDCVPLTYTFEDGPYMEGSFGITNIFKFLRVDMVKRFNYLENPNVPSIFGVEGLGIRARLKVEF